MTDFSAIDHVHMARALQLAERAAFTTWPNPMVGCVIADGERVLGEGWHQRAGEPHAEVFALRAAGEAARGATAYVTLEPCAHFGRTPPCADALIAAGVARVVVAAQDPFHQVDGKGSAKLRAAGIVVEHGLMQAQARALNRGFFSRIERGQPWLRVKLAMSLDGRTALANGESKWITSAAARADVQRWRARSSALLTSRATVLADDPHLTVRLGDDTPFNPPLRVVLDSALRSLAMPRVRDAQAPTLYVHASDADVPAGCSHFPLQRLAVARAVDGGLDLSAVLGALAERGINEVQVEAGPQLCGALLRAGLVDELLLYIAPVLLGDGGRPLFAGLGIETMAQRFDLQWIESRAIGPDWRVLLKAKKDETCSPD